MVEQYRMAYVRVNSVSALAPGSVAQAEVGEQTYAICNLDGQFHALGGTCPHAGGPLGEGTLQGANLVCPWHGFEFDCRSGENDIDPTMRVDRFAVRVDGDEVLLDPDSPL